MIFKFGLR